MPLPSEHPLTEHTPREPHEGCHERACECVTDELALLRSEVEAKAKRISELDAMLVALEEHTNFHEEDAARAKGERENG